MNPKDLKDWYREHQRLVVVSIALVIIGGFGLFMWLSPVVTPYFTVKPGSTAKPIAVTKSGAALEAEDGAVNNPATTITDSAASAGKAVRFNTASTSGLAKPTWSDEFSGNALSYATDNGGGTWRTKGYEAGGSLNNGYVDFAGSSWNAPRAQIEQHGLVSVENSVLSLRAKRNPGIPGVGARWIGVYLVSNHLNNLTWRYGYFEWRMRNSTPARGMFSTLWLFNNVPNRGDGHEGAEIDMIEVFGNRTGSPWYSGIHFNPGRLNGLEGRNVATTYTDTVNWHRYAIDWTPNAITYLRDGVVIGTVTGDQAAWFQKANLGIRINYAMDPNWLGGSGDYTTDNDPAPGTVPTMQVDYVRYYSQKPANLPGGTNDPY
jgi:hypothetical protein